MTAPQLGYVTACRVERVIDGDTLVILIPERRCHVRLLNVWAPELKQDGGIEAREYMRTLADGRQATLLVPVEDTARQVGDLLTFGRVLGRLWVNDVDVGEAMIAAGHATREKVK